MKKQILVIVMSVFTFTTYGQTPDEGLIKNFFNGYSKNPSKSIDDLYATNPWSVRIKDGIENIKKEINSYTEDYVGKYYGYELITKKQFSESFILYSYLVKYDRQPMRFIFKLYKPNDKWTLYSFKVDSDLDVEIEEAAKLYYLNLNKDK
jgi:hypothetical protein